MPTKVLLDTSFIIALINRDDPYHQRAVELDRELVTAKATVVVHWGILLEIGDGFARLGRRQLGTALLTKLMSEREYELQPLTLDLISRAANLYTLRSDKEWSLTDCVSFELMKALNLRDALTADTHFRQAGFTPLLLGT